ncbi:MAG: gluconokinase [Burkholderiaceae bacterium]|nr:gluconokinase [Burkholderiaceae bacterium]
MTRTRAGPIVLMGVSGCGKTSVGRALARRLGRRFLDADDFHPPGNVAKMRAALALDDDDRRPWLERLNALLRHAQAKDEAVVMACSALRRRYRDVLRSRVRGLLLVHLAGEKSLIAARLAARSHRYMPATLLDSQFAALEAPDDAEAAITVPIDAALAQTVERVARALAVRAQSNG